MSVMFGFAGVFEPAPSLALPVSHLKENGANTFREESFGEDMAHYFPGDRWQRLEVIGYWLRRQCISVNYDCDKTLCVFV